MHSVVVVVSPRDGMCAQWIKSCSQIGMKRYNSILAFRLDEFIFRSWKKRDRKSDIKSERKRNTHREIEESDDVVWGE